MIEVWLERRHIHLSAIEQSLAKAAASRHAIRLQLQARLASKLSEAYIPEAPLFIHPNTLKWMVTKYSEQLVFRPLDEVRYWFSYSKGIFLTPGYPPLFYSRTENRAVSPNKTAIAAVGEGIAGFIAQRVYHCRKLARPSHDYPDLVMVGKGKTFLVEAKATTDSPSQIQRILDDEFLRLAAYVSACKELDSRPIVGLLIGTALISETKYRCYITEVNV